MGSIVESWWNGREGRMNKRRTRLCHTGGRWTVERVLRWGDEDIIECRDEQRAREVLAQELTDGDRWRRIDDLSRPPGQRTD